MDTTLRSRLAHSEAAAADLLAQSMQDDGNHEVSTETFSAGLLVSLGPQRYVNRLMCTELNLAEDEIARTIGFFTSRNLPSSIQISSVADSGTSNLLRKHGFVVDWQRSVLAGRPAESPASASASASAAAARDAIEAVHDDGLDDWLSVLARGNDALSPEARATSDEFGRAARGVSGAIDLLARVDGRPAACGSLQPIDGVGWLGGAATVPEFRRRGLQRAMLDTRIEIAVRDGHEFVAATALPDSSSMRNLERVGLSLVDIQTVWRRQL